MAGTLRRLVLGACTFGLFFHSQPAEAQFQPGFERPGLPSRAEDIAVFDDGNGPALYVTGFLPEVDGEPVRHIVKWDGRAWSALGQGLGIGFSQGLSLAVHDDGSGSKLYVGGFFFSAGGVPANNVASWDGQNWSNVGDGISQDFSQEAQVVELVSHDDGSGPKLYGFSKIGIFVWDGVEWTEIPAGNISFSNEIVGASYDDGNNSLLYVAANPGFPPGQNAVQAWDGTSWSDVVAGDGGFLNNQSIHSFATYDDGSGEQLYIGGVLALSTDGQIRNLLRWDGTQWQDIPGAPDQRIESLAVFEGKLVAAARAGTSSGSGRIVSAWDGTTWTELTVPGFFEGPFDLISGMVGFDDGSGEQLYAAGALSRSGEFRAFGNIARWNGSAWLPPEAPAPLGVQADVRAVAEFDDGDGAAVYLAGDFRAAGDRVAWRIARLKDGRMEPVRNAQFQGLAPLDSSSPKVLALTTFDDGSGTKLYATGSFEGEGNLELNQIAAWDGTDWTPLANGLGFGEEGKALTVFDDGSGPDLYVGGNIDTISGVTINGVARWDGVAFSALDGAAGTGLTPSASAEALALAVFNDGSGDALYVGGNFDEAGGVAANGLARWRVSDGWTAVGGFSPAGASVTVRSLTVFDDGSGPALFVGGDFTQEDGVEVNGVVRWDGKSFEALTDAQGTGVGFSDGDFKVNSVFATDAGDGQKLFVGGLFDTAGGQAAYGMATWNGQSWSPLIGDVEPPLDVPEIYTQTTSGGSLYLGGRFTNLGPEASLNFGSYRDRPSLFNDGFESGDTSAWTSVFP